MIYGVQYYRPPFPVKKFWRDDFKKIKESGFKTVQLWIHWGWVEATPGEFKFDDYDELFEIAQQEGLSVLLSLCAELQPYWIHRIIPNSEMIDHMGNKVISSNRGEAHQGMTPGGCTDNPEVWKRMKMFLQSTVKHFMNKSNLIGWDCWNEIRWNIQSNGLVCYCKHTIDAYREWLKNEYGNLEGLNKVWHRRYDSWEDVAPGGLPQRPYTEIMAFERFLHKKVENHLIARVEAIKEVDSTHIVSAHDGAPISLYSWGKMGEYGSGEHMLHACQTGNMFNLSKNVDTFGTSHYPGSQTNSLSEFAAGVIFTRSASGEKDFWISELQGTYDDVNKLKKWYWMSISLGAKALISWSWRPEIFGREAGGFGIFDYTENVEKKLKMYNKIGEFICDNEQIIDNYHTDIPQVAIYHEIEEYNLEWAATGDIEETMYSLKGYSSALGNAKINYKFVDSQNMELDNIKLLIIHKASIIQPKAMQSIIEYVKKGGFLLLDGETDTFDIHGFYRYVGEDRLFTDELDITTSPSQRINKNSPYYQLDAIVDTDKNIEINLNYANKNFKLYGEEYICPILSKGEVLAKEKNAVIATLSQYGLGEIITVGTLLGKAYHRKNYKAFEEFLKCLAEQSGVTDAIEVRTSFDVFWNTGMTYNGRLVFLINNDIASDIEIIIPNSHFARAKSLFNNEDLHLDMQGDNIKIKYKLSENQIDVLYFYN